MTRSTVSWFISISSLFPIFSYGEFKPVLAIYLCSCLSFQQQVLYRRYSAVSGPIIRMGRLYHSLLYYCK
jgi:hypothetical protein